MTMIGFASMKGSPGVSLATVLTGSWWQRPVVCLEADPDGGSWALRYGLSTSPGLLELAAAGRHLRLTAPESVWDFAQQASVEGVAMVVAPDHPDQVAAALRSDGAALGEWCSLLEGVDVLVDLGRIGPGSASWSIAQWCDLVLMCAAPTADQLQPCAARLSRLAAAKVATGWLLIGDGPYSDAHITDTYGIPVTAHLPTDAAGAAAIDGRSARRVLRRSPLVREGRKLAETLGKWSDSERAVSVEDEEVVGNDQPVAS